jgi:hypothetical protein
MKVIKLPKSKSNLITPLLKDSTFCSLIRYSYCPNVPLSEVWCRKTLSQIG